MKKSKPHFNLVRPFIGFNKRERSGVFFLLLLLAVLQVTYFLVKLNSPGSGSSFTLNTQEQQKIDSIKHATVKGDTVKIYPFNPNFISDYKGYTLGMSPEEIDRLHEFRSQNRFVENAEEFQKVTAVSDSLVQAIAPYFRFPEWVALAKKKSGKAQIQKKTAPQRLYNLNTATAEQLQSIKGVGEKLSTRIVKFRDRLGGFLVNEQLYDVYGLDREVADRIMQEFRVILPPKIRKMNINTASVEELSALVYLRQNLAERIVAYRQDNGDFGSLDELTRVEGFPEEKIERIKLYLSL